MLFTCTVCPQDYYGKVLKKSSDLKTNACVTPAKPVPAFIRQALKSVHPEVSDKSVDCCMIYCYIVIESQ